MSTNNVIEKKNEVSPAATVIMERAKVETEVEKFQAEIVSLKAEIEYMTANASFSILGNRVSIAALEKEVAKVTSDAGRLVQLAKEYSLGSDVKSVNGGAVRVVTLAAVRKLGQLGVLGDKDKTKSRIGNVIAINQIIDGLAAFGLAKRIAE